MADITHDLAVARCARLLHDSRWRALHGIARECEAVVEPRRDRESYLTLGAHIKHARLHQERVSCSMIGRA